jgi:hypothetical protein
MTWTCWQCGKAAEGGNSGYLCHNCDVMWLRFELTVPQSEFYDPEFAANSPHP